MKRLKNREISLLTVFFIVFIFGMSIDYCLGMPNNVFNLNKTEEKTEYREEFLELKEELTEKYIGKDQKKQGASMKNRVMRFYQDKTSALSDYNEFILKDFLLRINARLCRIAGMSYIPGTSFVKKNDGMLISFSTEQDFDESDLKRNIDYLKSFVQSLEENGINYVYVNCPNKERMLADRLPLGFVNYKERDENLLVEQLLRENNIPTLDVLQRLLENYSNVQDMYYKTDHHWKVECGIEAAQYISEYLNNTYDYSIDTQKFELYNYNIEEYKQCMLGSTGNNATISFVEAEDFDLYSPKEKNECTFQIPDYNIDLTGDFTIFYNKNEFDSAKNRPFYAYNFYMYSNPPYAKIENTTIEDNHRILVIKDSFASVVIPYLAQGVKRIDVVEVRKELKDHFNGSVMSLIDENEYDTVLFIFSDFMYEYDRLYLK